MVALAFPDVLLSHVKPVIDGLLGILGKPLFVLVDLLLLACILLCLTPFARRRIGGAVARPEFSNWAWLSMLFAAGMGSGLVFWGVAEPALHVAQPPLKADFHQDPVAAAMAVTMVHWGLHAWALYAFVGLVLCSVYKGEVKPVDLGHPVAQALRGVLTGPALSTARRLTNFVGIVAVFFGVVGTIANSLLLIRKGISIQTGFTSPAPINVGVMALLFLVYLSSASTGLKRGIRLLSQFNMPLALVLVIGVLFYLPILPVVKIALQGAWEYLRLIASTSLSYEQHLRNPGWAAGWTYNYYFWWLAWGPFVGLFLVKISIGRPVWQYLMGVILVPTLVTLIWFSVFGGSAIAWDQAHNAGILPSVGEDYTQGIFRFFGEFGTAGTLFVWTCLVLLLVFVATSADSAIYVMGQLATPGTDSAAAQPGLRILLWAVAIAIAASALLYTNSEPLNRTIAILGAIPFLGIFALQIIGFVRQLFSGAAALDTQRPR